MYFDRICSISYDMDYIIESISYRLYDMHHKIRTISYGTISYGTISYGPYHMVPYHMVRTISYGPYDTYGKNYFLNISHRMIRYS